MTLKLLSQTETSDNRFIGKRLPNIDGVEKVTGSGAYSYDLKLHGMLHGSVKRSPHPHARIIGIDTSKALALDGVRAVVTGHDVSPSLRGKGVRDAPALAMGVTRFVGEPVAAVAAETEQIASEAAELIDVEYEVIPAVLDVEEAFATNPKVVVHPNLKEYEYIKSGPYVVTLDSSRPNVNQHIQVVHGNVDKAFKAAKLVVDNTYRTGGVHHYHTEPSSSIAKVESDGRITVYVGIQDAHKIRREISQALDMPESKFRIVVPKHIGGAFGNRACAREELLAVLLAMRTKRPVRIRLTREEVMMATTMRTPTVIRVTDAVNGEGRIVGRKVTAIYNGGAYTTEGITAVRNGILGAVGVYNIPNLWLDFYRVYTNQMEGGAFRAFGYSQIVFALEAQMDDVASRVGADCYDFRLNHLLRNGDTNAIGETMRSFYLDQCINAIRERMHAKVDAREGWLVGRGIAAGQKALFGGFTTTVLVKYAKDDFVEVQLGVFDMGQGVRTTITQFVAEELQHPLEKVRFNELDSDHLPPSTGATGSRQTFYAGLATLRACQDLKKKLLELGSRKLGSPPESLILQEGKIQSRSDNSKSIAVREILDDEVVGTGTYSAGTGRLDPKTGQVVGDRITIYYTPVAAGAEVAVHKETGMVEVRKIVVATDVGRAINPAMVEGQIDGCVAQGIGQALQEELVPHGGRILNPDNKDFRVTMAIDSPGSVERVILETRFQDGPLGAKGCGEAALAVVPAAIANAVANAIGRRINSLPITAEMRLRGLQEISK